MKASTVLMMATVLAIAPGVSTACQWFGTQLECDVRSSHVVIGTQVAARPTPARSFPFLAFAGDTGSANDPASPDELRIQLQDVGTDPKLCRKIGNETYCY